MEKLTLWPGGTGYFFEALPEHREGTVDGELVQQFIEALELPDVSEEDGPQDNWDCRLLGLLPRLLVRITYEDNRRHWLRSRSESIYMLPLEKLTGRGQAPAKTYDPTLSLALAGLLPEGFTNRDLLRRECEWRERAHVPEKAPGSSPGPTFEDILAQARELRHDPARRLLLPIENDEMAVLLAQGAPPDEARDSFGETALMQAVRKSDIERTELLLQAGANPNALNASGLTSLHLAGDHDIAMMLLGAGADINQPSQNGTTPLMMAVSSGKEELVELLLMSGANLEYAGGQGSTALAVAVQRMDAEMVRLLLRFGASKESARAVAKYTLRRALVKKEIKEAALELITEEERIRRDRELVQIVGEKLSAELDQEFDEDLVLARCLKVERLLS